MDISSFDYDLPKNLIAQEPSGLRDRSRLMVVDRSSGSIEHRKFSDITEYLKPGDGLVVNNTKVFKARLYGRRASGGKVEVFLVRKLDVEGENWLALVMPGRRVKEGESIFFDDQLSVKLEQKREFGQSCVSFGSTTSRETIIRKFGHVPLPHYINRDDSEADLKRYQTLFADNDKSGAVAAPTAGFHFTLPLIDRLELNGVRIAQLTLHVGPGTFKPIKVGDINDHHVDPEYAEITVETAALINDVRSSGGRLFAVGTTSVRTLESAPIINGAIQPFAGMVDLYIKPGFEFKVVDQLITNFHLPKSSLLVLVSAFCGRERIMAAYTEAIRLGYRFYSYGDAMLIQ